MGITRVGGGGGGYGGGGGGGGGWLPPEISNFSKANKP